MAVKMTAVRGAYPNREVGVGGRTYRTDDEGVVLVEVQHLPEMLRRGFSRTTTPEVFYDAPREPRPEILSLPVDTSVITQPRAGDDPIHEYEPAPSEVLTALPSQPDAIAAVLVDRARLVRRQPAKQAAKPRGRPRKAVVG